MTDVKILELLASKICHDLISPIGAIANGVEFLEEMGADAGDDVTELIAFSAKQASAKLQALRLAYGAGGADSSIKPEDVHKIFGGFIGGENRVTQEWDPHALPAALTQTRGFAKILMTALLLAVDSLPKGGTITLAAEDESHLSVTATGENAGLKDGVLHALENRTSPENIEPKLVHPYVTGLLARHYGIRIVINDDNADIIVLKLSVSDVP